MRSIAIYGAGGFGREVALMISQINVGNRDPWHLAGFYDDGKEKGTIVDGLPVLGNIDDLNRGDEPMAITLAVADPSVRKEIRERIRSKGTSFPTLVHPSANIGDLARNHFEEGVLITAGNIFTTSVYVHSFTIINIHCTIGHDVRIGPFSTIMPGCSVSGAVTVGSEVLIGSGARLLPGISVGDRSKVGAGAVLLEDVPRGVTVVGVPAKVVRRDEGED